jgi:hypothetical protein
VTTEYAVKLKIWRDSDGLYLLKGGGPEVWKRFRIKKKWREAQGIIHGAFLIDIVLAAWLAATQPDRQRALVVGLALSYLLVALSLLYSTISAQSSGYMSLESMKILRVLTDVWLPEFKFGPACVRATDMIGLAKVLRLAKPGHPHQSYSC